MVKVVKGLNRTVPDRCCLLLKLKNGRKYKNFSEPFSLKSTSSGDDGLRIRASSKIEKLSDKNSQFSLQQELMVKASYCQLTT